MLVVALAFGGCSCEDPATTDTQPNGQVSTTTLSFGEICNDSLKHLTFDITNVGSGNLAATARVVGESAVHFEVNPASFSLNGTGAKQTITVTYKPTGEDEAGRRHLADLEISYQGDGAEVIKVSLDGEVSSAEVEPRISFACGTKEDGSPLPACATGVLEPCCAVGSPNSDGATLFNAIGLGEPRVGTTGVLPLRVENVGCGELTIDKLELTGINGRCPAESVELVGADAPISVPGGLGAGQGHEFAVAFTPPEECSIAGRIELTSNDLSRETYSVSFIGNGRMARLNVSDTQLFFGEILAPDTKDLSFYIRNTGRVAVDISSIGIKPAGSDFSIVSITKDACVDDGTGEKVPAGNPTPVDVSGGYTIGESEIPALCGDDELLVTVRYTPGTPADQDAAEVEILNDEGRITVQLRGGASPQIEEVPKGMSFLFQHPAARGCDNDACGYENSCQGACVSSADCTGGEACLGGVCLSSEACVDKCEMSQKSIQIWNKGPAPLLITDLQLEGALGGDPPVDPADGNRPLFTIVDDDCRAAGIAKDTFCTVTIGFKAGNAGGTSSANLIVSNNTPAQERFEILIRGFTPSDTVPTPEVVKEPVNPRKGEWVRLDASNSTDDGDVITDYRWEFRGHGSGATGLPKPGVIDPANPNPTGPDGCNVVSPPSPGGAPANSCYHFPIPGSTRVLEFYAPLQGTYDFGITVWDDACVPQSSTRNSPVEVSN